MISIEKIDIDKIWLIGFRPHFSKRFISVKPFEEEANNFFNKSLSPFWNNEQLGSMFIKRNNYIYEQNLEELNEYLDRLKNDKNYYNPRLEKKSSSLGLPYVISYTEKETGIDIEFDGILFKSQKLFCNESLSFLEAKEKVETEGKYKETVEFNHEWEDLLKNSSGRTSWFYVTENAKFKFDETPNELRQYEFVGRYELVDRSFIRITHSVGRSESEKTFDFYFGRLDHIVQILGNDFESLLYLRHLEDTLIEYGRKTSEIKNRIINPSFKMPNNPFGWFNVRNWWEAVSYSNNINQDLQNVIKTRMLLLFLKKTVESFQELIDHGIAHYNLESDICIIDKDVKPSEPTALNQYNTIAPLTLFENNGKMEVKYDSKYSSFNKHPPRIISCIKSLDEINKEIYELIQSIATTTSLQSGILAIVIAVIAIFTPYFIEIFKKIIEIEWQTVFKVGWSYICKLIDFINKLLK